MAAPTGPPQSMIPIHSATQYASREANLIPSGANVVIGSDPAQQYGRTCLAGHVLPPTWPAQDRPVRGIYRIRTGGSCALPHRWSALVGMIGARVSWRALPRRRPRRR
jgi:hypothetical protein